MSKSTRLIASIVCVLLVESAVYAEQIRTGTATIFPSAGNIAPVKSMPSSSVASPIFPMSLDAKPMRDVLVLKQMSMPPMCVSIPQTYQRMVQLAQELKEISGVWLGPSSAIYTSYIPCCAPEKSFSVQEQQAAGCLGSDMVSQCMEKLARHCIAPRAQGFHAHEELQNISEKAKNISVKAQELSQQVQYMNVIMP